MNHLLVSQITILVPTYNRYPKLQQLLTYTASVGMTAPMWILDSSSELLRNDQLEQQMATNHIGHRRYDPATPPMEKLADGLDRVSTPYVAVWNDDDFLVPRALDAGVRFLDQHPDYSIAHGRSAIFRLGSPAGRKAVEWIAPYPERAIVEATASERLVDHFTRYGAVLNYSVHRTELLRGNVQQCCARGGGYSWGELALGGLDVIQGKAHCLNQLYLMKEVHEGPDAWISWAMEVNGRDPQMPHETTQAADIFTWFTEPSFPAKYAAFRECLAAVLVRVDGITQVLAEGVVTEAFWSYAVRALSKKWQGRYGTVGQNWPGRMREVMRQLPAARAIWHKVQPWLPGGRQAMSLPALLCPGSPAHEDFMPIYRAILESAVEQESLQPEMASVRPGQVVVP